jgi:transcriptional regulator with XRE-family HTH domain
LHAEVGHAIYQERKVLNILSRKDWRMALQLHAPAPELSRGVVLGKAAVTAADRLGLTARALARVIGVSEPYVSRMKRGALVLEDGSKPYELAALLVRVFRSLDAVTGGDETVARAWMRAQKITSVQGLCDVVAYLDARRAPL